MSSYSKSFVFAAALLIGGHAAAADFPASKTVHYECDNGQKMSASYLQHGEKGAEFVVLKVKGQEYGLARAISASGARYAGLYGLPLSEYGLEWWEAKGEARLGAFTGKDFFETRPLLTGCKPRP